MNIIPKIKVIIKGKFDFELTSHYHQAQVPAEISGKPVTAWIKETYDGKYSIHFIKDERKFRIEEYADLGIDLDISELEKGYCDALFKVKAKESKERRIKRKGDYETHPLQEVKNSLREAGITCIMYPTKRAYIDDKYNSQPYLKVTEKYEGKEFSVTVDYDYKGRIHYYFDGSIKRFKHTKGLIKSLRYAIDIFQNRIDYELSKKREMKDKKGFLTTQLGKQIVAEQVGERWGKKYRTVDRLVYRKVNPKYKYDEKLIRFDYDEEKKLITIARIDGIKFSVEQFKKLLDIVEKAKHSY